MPFDRAVIERLDRIEFNLNRFIGVLITMSSNLDANFLALQTQVQQNTDVEASAVQTIQGIATQLQAAIAANAAGDSAALPQLQAQLASSASALAAAIAANTTPAPASASGSSVGAGTGVAAAATPAAPAAPTA